MAVTRGYVALSREEPIKGARCLLLRRRQERADAIGCSVHACALAAPAGARCKAPKAEAVTRARPCNIHQLGIHRCVGSSDGVLYVHRAVRR